LKVDDGVGEIFRVWLILWKLGPPYGCCTLFLDGLPVVNRQAISNAIGTAKLGRLEKFNYEREPADETHVLFRPRPLRLFGLRQFFVVPISLRIKDFD
jgi:hypothetical protein